MKVTLNVTIFWLSILIARADPKTETDIVLSRINQMPIDSEVKAAFEKAVNNPSPRIYELMRRIEIESNSGNLGNLDCGIGRTNKDFLYPQIDSLLNEEVNYADGIIAVRVVNFFQRYATRIVYWKRSERSQDMTKTVWKRNFPSGIDLRDPTDEWLTPESVKLKSTEECKQLISLFDDPMPASTLSVAAHQFAGTSSYIIEMIASSDGKIKYNWAVRSPRYSGLKETMEFEKIWDAIGELPTEK